MFIHTHVIANLYKCLCFSETLFRQAVLLHALKCRPVQLQKWQKYHKTAIKVVHMRRVLYSSHVHKWFLELSANYGGKDYQRVTVYSCSNCILIYEPLRLLTELPPPLPPHLLTSLPTSPPLSQGVCVRCHQWSCGSCWWRFGLSGSSWRSVSRRTVLFELNSRSWIIRPISAGHPSFRPVPWETCFTDDWFSTVTCGHLHFTSVVLLV